MIRLDEIAPVSVVIPCFRCGRTIGRALASVMQQSQIPAEVILVDDASGDDTWRVLTELAQADPGWIKLIRLNENQGAASARNAGWAVASQPYIAFLDADDAWHPRKIEIQYTFMSANPDVALCGHGHRLLTHSVLPDWNVVQGDAKQITKWALLLSNRFVTPSTMLRRGLEQRFNEKQRYMEDHLLWLEIFFSGARVVKLSAELVAIYKPAFGASGLSAQFWLMERGELGNYWRLYQKQFIKGYQWLALAAYSVLKFVRRLIVYWGILRWKK